MFLITAAGCQSQEILVWPTEAIFVHLLKYTRILKGYCSQSLWVWVSLELTQNTVLSGDTPLIQGKHHLLISTFCSFTLPGKHAWQKQSGSFCDCIECPLNLPIYLPDISPRVSDGEHRITLSQPWHPDHVDHLESRPNLFYFRPPKSIFSKATTDSQRISRYDSKFESNPN